MKNRRAIVFFLACSAIFACRFLCVWSITTARMITTPLMTICQNSETPHIVMPSLMTPISALTFFTSCFRGSTFFATSGFGSWLGKRPSRVSNR